jgi:hypothetical protein
MVSGFLFLLPLRVKTRVKADQSFSDAFENKTSTQNCLRLACFKFPLVN